MFTKLNTKMLVIIFSICIISSIQAIDFNAVVVGINDYEPANDPRGGDLAYAVNDAEDLRDCLVKHQGWKYENITGLFSVFAEKDNIENAIKDMPNSKRNSNLFHFSGHGNDE